MTRRLFFHIGPHKTGSTSIQHGLANCGDPRVFNEMRNKKSGAIYNEWFGNSWLIRDPKKPLFEQASFEKILPEKLGAHNPDGDVVFSSEDMSWIFDPEILKRFCNALYDEFDEVKIIVYLRRQDRAAVSFMQQATKPSMSFFSDFLTSYRGALPEITPNLRWVFDYNKRFALWADAFGEEAMVFSVFGDAVRGEGLLQNFASITGLQFSDFEIHKRIGLPKAAQYLNQVLMEMDIKNFDPSALMRLIAEGEKMSPPRAQAEAFYEEFRESNSALNRRFGINERETIFDDDFAKYSVEGNERLDLETTEQIVDALILATMNVEAARILQEKERNKLRKRLRRLKTQQKSLAQKSASQ